MASTFASHADDQRSILVGISSVTGPWCERSKGRGPHSSFESNTSAQGSTIQKSTCFLYFLKPQNNCGLSLF